MAAVSGGRFKTLVPLLLKHVFLSAGELCTLSAGELCTMSGGSAGANNSYLAWGNDGVKVVPESVRGGGAADGRTGKRLSTPNSPQAHVGKGNMLSPIDVSGVHARRLLTGGMDSDFASTALPARSRRNLALLGSLSSSRPSIHDGHGSPRRSPPVATAWGNVEDGEAGTPYMPQRARPKTGKSPISANRQYYLPSERADALFQLTLPSEQRTHIPGLSLDGTWATTSSAAAESLYETPTTSPERRNQTQRRNQMPGTTPDRISQIANAEANAEAQSFSSPRSASRLLDDNLADEDLL